MTTEKRPRTASQLIRQIVQRRHPNMGCSDGSCIFGHPGGMQTNGGCNCIKERDYPMPQRNLMVLRDVVQVLASIVSEEDVEAQAQRESMLGVVRERDILQAERDDARTQANICAGVLATTTKERDEAREEAKAEIAALKAEVARLQQALRDSVVELDYRGQEKAAIYMEERVQMLLDPPKEEES